MRFLDCWSLQVFSYGKVSVGISFTPRTTVSTKETVTCHHLIGPFEFRACFPANHHVLYIIHYCCYINNWVTQLRWQSALVVSVGTWVRSQFPAFSSFYFSFTDQVHHPLKRAWAFYVGPVPFFYSIPPGLLITCSPLHFLFIIFLTITKNGLGLNCFTF